MDVRCPRLVGRERELATLRGLLGGAREGSGAVAFVSGEPGLGKSRLINELVKVARAGHASVLTGRAVPTPAGTAYRPLAEILAQVVRDRPITDDADLAPWRPALQAMLPTLGASPADGAEATAHICGEAIVRLLRSRDASPVVVVLEDLHWADPDTLDVLEYLADNIATESALCLATLRDDAPAPAVELARRLDQRGTATHLPLGRLTDHETAEMAMACLPEAATDLVTRVQANAEGVPLLVEELVATPGVPASVGEAVRTRVSALTENERTVLYAAAVLGRDFEWELVPTITGLPTDQVASALERMVETMLVNVDADAGFRFRHALTREAVVEMLIPPRRAALARTALAALDELTHEHADLALQAGDRSRAGALLSGSGREALRRGALGTAVQTLRRAVELVDDPTDTQLALVEALALAGRIDEALDVGDELLERLGTTSPSAAAAHIELARAAVAATRWPTAVTHLDAANGLLASQADAQLTEQADVLEAEVALANDELDRARAAAHRALGAAESTGSPQTVCHALELIGRSHRVHDLVAAREAFSRAYRTAEGHGLPLWRMRALHELGTIELLDHGGADALNAAGRTAEQLGAPSTATVLDLQLTAVYHLHFDLVAAHTHGRRAVARSRQLSLGRIHAAALAMDACTCAIQGDRAAMDSAVAQAMRAAPNDAEIEGMVWAGATGVFEVFWGDRQVALAAMDRGMAALHAVGHSAPAHYRGLWALLHAVEDGPDAAGHIDQVRRSGVTVMRPNRGYLHYAQAVLERSPERVGTGDAELGYAPVWLHLGRMLVAEAALADGWGAPQPWLREARDCFDTHGLDHLSRSCTRLLGETPRRAPPDVTAREAEVLDLVAQGMANKQIATRLHLSVRTVEKHVESLLRKTGAQSRTQLVAMLGETT